MGIVPFLKRILTSPERTRTKNRVLKNVSSTTQRNDGVVNVYRIDTQNSGDYYCAPHHYFDQLRNSGLDIYGYKSEKEEITRDWEEKISANALIIGGGGLLNRGSFEKQMKLFEELSAGNKKTVLWGAGHNSKLKKDFNRLSSYNIDPRKFGVAGTRDYKLSENWVPCVSCLHPVFDKKQESTREIGVIFHKKTLKRNKITSRFSRFPCTSNTSNLEDLINFIGQSENIITDSYHAMYWAILLEKKVVVIPNSSKFFDFKYDPIFSDFDNCLQDIKKARKYSGVLDECREINHNFAKEVFEYLEI